MRIYYRQIAPDLCAQMSDCQRGPHGNTVNYMHVDASLNVYTGIPVPATTNDTGLYSNLSSQGIM
jgi:hypothetical protein